MDVVAIRKKRCKDYIPYEGPLPIFDSETSECVVHSNKYHISHLQEDCVLVKNKESMKTLYCKGFFGKGTLSKSGPHVCYPQKEKSVAKNESDSESNASDDESSSSSEPERMDKSEDYSNEALQLTFMEAYFLSYGLGCLVVMDEDGPLDLEELWQKFCDLTPDGLFPYKYAAYHYLRSERWVVRSGIKYGADFLLYKDGPCYYHSSSAVIVKPVSEENFKDIQDPDAMPLRWCGLAGNNRLLSHVSKALMFLYVISPVGASEQMFSSPSCISKLELQEVYVKHWMPSSYRLDKGGEEED